MKNDDGISGTMGAMLLVSVAVIGVVVVGVTMTSQDQVSEIPQIAVVAGLEKGAEEGEPNTLYLYHSGGDTLKCGDFELVVDGIPRSDYCIVGGDEGTDEWSVDTALELTCDTENPNVQIIHTSTGVSTLLKTTVLEPPDTSPENEIQPDTGSITTVPSHTSDDDIIIIVEPEDGSEYEHNPGNGHRAPLDVTVWVKKGYSINRVILSAIATTAEDINHKEVTAVELDLGSGSDAGDDRYTSYSYTFSAGSEHLNKLTGGSGDDNIVLTAIGLDADLNAYTDNTYFTILSQGPGNGDEEDEEGGDDEEDEEEDDEEEDDDGDNPGKKKGQDK
ncbi:type IV pilin [Methanoculleus frigidifontis]|nr:type IV pilin [Methanoculleus sp. FWC-SCC1]